MRYVMVAGVVVLGAVPAALRLQTRSQPTPAPTISPPAAVAPNRPRPTPTLAVFEGPLPSVEAPAAERPAAVANTSAPERRDSGRLERNRYPGRIPTPAEWRPPEGPVRIALQAGHWRAAEAPPELNGLKDNGTRWQDKAEWEVNLEIAQRTRTLLEEMGYMVDILPAVVPPDYRAHLFISIHADGSGDPDASGYRVAPPRRDATGRAASMAALLEESYGEATGLERLPTVTRRMQNYYAFNYRRYQHALHPMTIAVILETGFLTSAMDREVIINDQDRVARGIVAAVAKFPETRLPEAAEGL